MTALEYFRLNASEFNNVIDSDVLKWIDQAGLFVNTDGKTPAKAALALALMGAHLCWLNKYPGNGGGSRGNVIEEKKGDDSRKYRPIDKSDTWLGQSSYGMLYGQLFGVGVVHTPAIITRYGLGC